MSAKNEGYRSAFSRIIADHLFKQSDLSGLAIEAVRRWLTAQQLPAGKTIWEVIPDIADEVEAIITGNINGQLVGEGIAAVLLRAALAEVEWTAITVQLVKDILDELTGG